MRFELDKPLTDEILFYMENQNGDFFLDAQTSKIVNMEDNNYDKSRYIPLPGWDSNDGFRLMEKFAAEIKNPVLRSELSAALNVKRGVFRSFKNVLEQYPEAEKLWRNFKNKKMKDDINEWYNALREEWGLEPIGGEPSDAGSEDISTIVLEDFIFRDGNESDEKKAEALHKFFFPIKISANSPGEDKTKDFSDGIFIIAETVGGDFCGYIRAVNNGSFLEIKRFEIKPEYQGMGIGKTLLAKFSEKTPEKKAVIDLPENLDFFSRVLHIEDFKPVSRRFVRDTE